MALSRSLHSSGNDFSGKKEKESCGLIDEFDIACLAGIHDQIKNKLRYRDTVRVFIRTPDETFFSL